MIYIEDFGLACDRHGISARRTEVDSRYLCPDALDSETSPAEDAVGAMDDAEGDFETDEEEQRKARPWVKRVGGTRGRRRVSDREWGAGKYL